LRVATEPDDSLVTCLHKQRDFDNFCDKFKPVWYRIKASKGRIKNIL